MQFVSIASTFSKETTLWKFCSTRLKFTYSEKATKITKNKMRAQMFWLDDFWLETKGTINHPGPKHFCPRCIFKNFVAFSEYVNFSFVLQEFHKVVSFENVDAITQLTWIASIFSEDTTLWNFWNTKLNFKFSEKATKINKKYNGGRNVWVGWFFARNQGNHQNFDP